MLIAKITNGVVEAIGDPSSLFPNTSFTDAGPDAEFLADNSCLVVNNSVTWDQNTQKTVECPAYIDGSVVRTVQVLDLTEEELTNRLNTVWNQVRSTRGQLLRNSDWTQIADVPLNTSQRQAWSVYRQALRDVTTQEDPYNIVWPVSPAVDVNAGRPADGN